MCRFAYLSLERSIPDHTILKNFRHILAKHRLGRQLSEVINLWLEETGILHKERSTIDATIIEASSSTKNKLKLRDPEMHQTIKGDRWHFAMKAHIGLDISTGLIHSFTCTAAN